MRALVLQVRSGLLASFLDGTRVDGLWRNGSRVNWETGIVLPPRPDGRDASTHCSAFVAAIAKRLGVYILRPPEHEQQLLANAQADWLAGKGRLRGWQPLSGELAAQDQANRGALVVASYRNDIRKKPGHIAIVRPSSKDLKQLKNEGPQITQAGEHNYISASLVAGFGSRRSRTFYFANPIDWIVQTSRVHVLAHLSSVDPRRRALALHELASQGLF